MLVNTASNAGKPYPNHFFIILFMILEVCKMKWSEGEIVLLFDSMTTFHICDDQTV
jgi:hypothetical protein